MLYAQLFLNACDQSAAMEPVANVKALDVGEKQQDQLYNVLDLYKYRIGMHVS